jgi:tetratricopeptide (TPR) repeat protein
MKPTSKSALLPTIVGLLLLGTPNLTTAGLYGTQSFPNADPTSTVSYLMNQGRALISRGEFDQAVASYSQALSLSSSKSTTVELLAERGAAFRLARRIDDALNDFDHAIKLYPNSPVLYLFRGIVYARKGQFQKAWVDVSECIRQDPHDPIAYA